MRQNRYVQIPDVITVHLGGKAATAPNITLPFVDYLKGCAACLICPTWPEQAQRANIYAITSFALHRVSSRWYRARGCDFDITGSVQDDLPFNSQTCLFCNTSSLVEELFNNYLTLQGSGEPLLAKLCPSGQTGTEIGVLYQDGAVAMAEKGYTYYDILKRYYGEDIAMIENAPHRGERERFLGTPLMCGASGEDIRTIKRQLNRIGQNYPAIVPLNIDSFDFDLPCERAVRTFQYIFDLPITGVLDKATWYSIKRTCAGIEQSDAALFEQNAAPVIGPVPLSQPSGVSQGAAKPNSSLRRQIAEGKKPSLAIPGRLIRGNTLPSIVIPGDNTLDSVISDSGIAEEAKQESAQQEGLLENNAIENAARWSTTRQRILQEAANNISPGSIIADRGIASRAEAANPIPGHPVSERVEPEKSPISDRGVREGGGVSPENNAIENAARWSTTRQRILQEAANNISPGSIIADRGIASRAEAASQIPGHPVSERIEPEKSPISDRGVREGGGVSPENNAVENAARWSTTRQRIVQEAANNISPGSIIADRGIASRAEAARQIPGHPVSERVEPEKSPISDRGVREGGGASPQNNAIENAARWSTTRQRILQEAANNISPGSIIADRGIASRAEAASQIPGHPVSERVEPEKSPISDRNVREEKGASLENNAVENAARWSTTRQRILQEAANNISPGSIIADRGIASRAEAARQIPGHPVSERIEPEKSPISDSDVREEEGAAPESGAVENEALWNIERRAIPPTMTAVQHPIRQPTSPAERLVIGPSVSVPLPDAETGVGSGHAVEWLKQIYGI